MSKGMSIMDDDVSGFDHVGGRGKKRQSVLASMPSELTFVALIDQCSPWLS